MICLLAFTFYVIMAQSINLRDTNEFFRNIKQEYTNIAYTENNARAYKSTGNKLLDLFSRMSISRSFLKKDEMGKKYLDDDILNLCLISFDESPILTPQAIIYARDILNGHYDKI